MNGVLVAFAVSFGVVFVAELGDKSQLMALTFATRYRALPVLVGITLATALVHAVSVAVGHGLGSALPTGWIVLVSALAFLGFGAWTLRGDSLDDDEQAKAERSEGSAVVAASVAFFLAELGDKTMLATITLATQYGWFGTWLGSTLGMVAADALAILVGRRLGRALPEEAVKVGASVLFGVFGVWLLVDALDQLGATAAIDRALNHHLAGWIALALGLVAVGLGTLGRHRMRRVGAITRVGLSDGLAGARLARVLTQGLLEENYQVDVARDGRLGLERMLTTPFDLCILDVLLPSLDGFEVLRTTGVLFSGAKPPFDYVEIIDISGVNDFLTDAGGDAVGAVAREMGQFADGATFIKTERL